MYKLVIVLFLVLFANANELVLENGQINAHTEVFGDSTIDPQTKKINAKLTKDLDIESIRGVFEIDALSLVSDNESRDEHMYETLNTKSAPKISFKISSISKSENSYKIEGVLNMNNQDKEIFSIAEIKQNNNIISMDGEFSIKLTDFGLEPPKMFFLTVRDLIDIKYSFNLKEN